MTRPAPSSARGRRRSRRLLVVLATLVVAVGAGAAGAATFHNLTSPTEDATTGSTTDPTEQADPTDAATPTETAATPEASPTGPPPPEPSTLTLVAAGDILPHDTVLRRAGEAAAEQGQPGWDFSPLWAPLDPWVSGADLALCHLEVPLIPDGDTPSGYPMFGSPTSLAQDIAEAGWDGCSTASNHSVDRGWTGLTTTLDAFDAAGLGHAGTARTAEEAAAPQTYVLERGGRTVTIAQIAATYGTNGLPIPADAPWSVQLIDGDQLIAQATAAREAGADLVVASIHWGTEYQDSPDSSQTARPAAGGVRRRRSRHRSSPARSATVRDAARRPGRAGNVGRVLARQLHLEPGPGVLPRPDRYRSPAHRNDRRAGRRRGARDRPGVDRGAR